MSIIDFNHIIHVNGIIPSIIKCGLITVILCVVHRCIKNYKKELYNNPKYLQKFFEKSFANSDVDHFIKLAKEGNVSAASILAEIYIIGSDYIKPDDELAMKWLNVALEADEPYAQYLMAEKYFFGVGLEKDVNKAIRLLEKSSNNGFSEASYKLATIYHPGEPVAQDLEKAFKYFSKGKEQGCLKCCVEVGLMYEAGEFVKQSSKTAVKFYKKAAKKGLARAQFLLADMYYFGEGIKKDRLKAYDLYKRAYQNNDDSSLDIDFALGRCWIERGLGDVDEAFHHFRRSYISGNKTAIEYLCLLYGGGLSEQQGEIIFQLATEALKAETSQDPNDQFALGFCYEVGLGTEKNYELAFLQYQKAAEQNHGWGQNYLAYCYSNGMGTEKNSEKSMYWLKLAAKKVPMAQYNLGIDYYNESNYDESLKWFNTALKNGYPPAIEMINIVVKEKQKQEMTACNQTNSHN